MFKGIIFDVDGVLFDTEPLHVKAWFRTAQESGFTITEDYLAGWIGKPCTDLAADLKERAKIPVDTGALLMQKEREFFSLLRSEEYFSGRVGEYLKEISLRVPVAWATTSSRESIEIMFEKAGIMDYFSYGVCYEDVSRTKPHPEPYLKAAEGLGLAPHECAAVDDSPAGTRSASDAGIYTVGISAYFSAKELKYADRHFNSTAEAMEWLLGSL